MTIDDVFAAVKVEVERAQAKFGPFKNGHEGYAVLLEEVDELWHEVKHGDDTSALKEAVHVAAMAVRFLIDLGENGGRASHGNPR
jgi:NTP pyrophosphatase (non-canonical NTP hydrolase)